ncbi:LysR family transcriptional regulator [Pseudohalocynthiibacter aestuariivivens]|nr:LysR substrate-binding domain-containing protein [Pseudohalocynthiibacter aestuariivivens]QIE46561.1 LysR family transcriptional regulator [Pseudohalocynthiibacter aestuariivivens]
MTELNSDLLRSFLAVTEAGSVTEGAMRIHRSQSAVSLQIRKLEDIVGHPLFERHGRGITLTATGRELLPVARDVTRTLSHTLRRLSADRLHGRLRIGLPDDQTQGYLTRILGAFTQSHPMVELDVTCALSAGFPDALAAAKLDIAVYETAEPEHSADVLRREQTCWSAARFADFPASDALPVALFDQACWWRDVALAALDAAGRPYRVVYSSQSVAGVIAAIEAGIAVGLLGENSLTRDLRRLGTADGFGETPCSHLILARSPGATGAALDAMEAAIRTAFATGETVIL